jgi:hypothetical protein
MTPWGLADVYVNIMEKPAISIFIARNEYKPLLQNAGSYLPKGMNISGEMNLEFRTD